MAKVILVVEDEPKSLKLTRDLLQMTGYEAIADSSDRLPRAMTPADLKKSRVDVSGY